MLTTPDNSIHCLLSPGWCITLLFALRNSFLHISIAVYIKTHLFFIKHLQGKLNCNIVEVVNAAFYLKVYNAFSYPHVNIIFFWKTKFKSLNMFWCMCALSVWKDLLNSILTKKMKKIPRVQPRGQYISTDTSIRMRKFCNETMDPWHGDLHFLSFLNT